MLWTICTFFYMHMPTSTFLWMSKKLSVTCLISQKPSATSKMLLIVADELNFVVCYVAIIMEIIVLSFRFFGNPFLCTILYLYIQKFVVRYLEIIISHLLCWCELNTFHGLLSFTLLCKPDYKKLSIRTTTKRNFQTFAFFSLFSHLDKSNHYRNSFSSSEVTHLYALFPQCSISCKDIPSDTNTHNSINTQHILLHDGTR